MTRCAVYSVCLTGRSYLAERESSNTPYVVYSVCLNRRSYLAANESSNTPYAVYSACLNGYRVIRLKERGWTHGMLFTPFV